MSDPRPPDSSSTGVLQAAAEHHRAGRLPQAEELYRQILRDNADHAEALHGIGLLALQVGRPELAAAFLGRAGQLGPHVPVYQYNQGEAWMIAGEFNQGAACYRRAIALDPARPEPHAALGVALGRMQRFAEAAQSLQKSVDLGMDRSEVYQHLGNALLQLNRFAESEAFARKAIERSGSSAESWQTLGEAIGNQERPDEAMECFRRAIALKGDFALPHYTLGMTLGRVGRVDEAIESLRAALRLRAEFPEALTTLGTMLIGRRMLDEAIETLRKAARLRPMDVDTHIELARALELAQRHQEAAEAFKEILKLSPDNPNVRFHIAALSGKDVPPAPPASLVKALFDQHARTFDEHLAGLDYRVPRLLLDAVTVAGVAERPDVLDLGCGTGLCGELLRPMAGTLAGVDLSPAMIEKSRERGIYDRLEVGEVTAVLRAAPAAYDLLVAGDVLCYLGDLSDAFASAASALRPGGLLAFSVETHEGDGWLLRPSRRYAHNPDYIKRAAVRHGFDIIRLTRTVLRKEGGRDVNGLIAAFRRPKADVEAKS